MEENIEKFEEFFRKFYYDRLLKAGSKGEDSIVVDYRDLERFDPVLADLLLKEPNTTINQIKESMDNIDIGAEEPIQPRFENIPDSEKLRIKDVRSRHIGRMIKIEGVVRRASEVNSEVRVGVFECPDCGDKIEVVQLEKMLKYPSRCDCGRKRGFKLVDRKLHDTRYIILEDPFEMAVGEEPGKMRIFLKDDLTTPEIQKRTDPGARLEITGILKEVPKRVRGRKTKQLEKYLECNHIGIVELELEDLEITEEDEEKIKELASDPNVYEKLINSIAPSMYGLDEIKEALLLQLFGGVPATLPDGTKIRGDIHVLVVGDPSSGKTQLLKLVTELVPRGRYVSGKGTSAAGLTATVSKDEEFMGGWVLEAGAVVLANKSIIGIDEFDKMSKEDQINLHEAMSTQSYHPDTVIDLADGSQRKIKDIVEGLFQKHKSEIVEGEDCLMLKVPETEDLRLLSTDFKKIFPKKPTRVSKHKAPKYFYKIKTSSGREIKVTPEHPCWTIKDGEILCKRADSIDKGEWIPVPSKLPIAGKKQPLEKEKLLRKGLFDTVPEVGKRVFTLLKKLNISQKPLIGWTLTDYKNNEINFTRQTLKRILPKIEEKYLDLLGEIKYLKNLKDDMKELRRIRKKFGIEAKEISNKLDISPASLYYRENNCPQFFEEHKKVILSLLKDKFSAEKDLEFLKKLTFGDIRWVKVKDVEKNKNKDLEWVYDVTLPGEIFISNGMVLHNTVSISKANIQATLPAKTSVVAGANPKLSRFDPYRPISEQIEIPDTLLSRFDLKFVLRDVPDKERDGNLVDHVIKTRTEEEKIEPLIDHELLKKYVGYARKNKEPELTKKALAICKNFFVDLRSKYASEGDSVPLTLRQYEALIRLSEAAAKIRLADKVEERDAKRAIKIMKRSIKQLGYDPETGKIDIDRAEGGVSSSKRNKIRIVMDTLDELKESIGKNIPVSDLISALEEEGIEEHAAENIIREMKNKGMLFEPRSGYIQKI